ncbi:hypothetical protein BGW36DRAFT_404733 [Talaromyces proteolyticus]|uniref:Zn(2)-C6 fungal-type domain-containing protein n=1 Tax=Talaromyces proteolyticus TaxID=1131652 RepID=A0AAD4Q3I5_9EURO|nr:uncharacterized protein BGW36DRAFT_404733 [Talaromyces proteolyticus]KAH8701813.1 hypothetical protein BGW36DRAFT_404733 [Talaromyces proteolyticus]
MPEAKSCDHCRSRKVRCDGVHPRCGACVRRQQNCVYGRDSRFRHGMRRRRRARISELSARTSDLISAPGEAEYESRVDFPRPPFLSSPLNSGSPATSYLDDALLVVGDGNSTNACPADLDVLPTKEYGTVHPAANEHHENGGQAHNSTEGHSTQTKRCILDYFRNVYSSSSMLAMPLDSSATEIRKARLVSNAALRRQQESMILQPGGPLLDIDFDNDSDSALHLLRLHWNRIDLPRLVTYRPAFTDSLINGGPYVNKILLNGIYYSSSVISESESFLYDSRHPKSDGSSYYSKFCEHLRLHPDQPSFATAMGLVICATSLLSQGLTHECMELYGKARRMFVELEYQLRVDTKEISPNFEKLSAEIEMEMLNRLRFGVFALDTLIRLYIGPLRTSPIPIPPSVELLDSFEELEEWVPYVASHYPSHLSIRTFNPLPTRAVSIFTAQIHLYQIFSDFLQTFFIDKDFTANEYASRWVSREALESRLESWRLGLPSDLQIDCVQSRDFSPHHLDLLASYHTLKILLQRPFLEQESLRALLSDESRILLENICNENALEICRVLTKYRETFSFQRASLITSFSAYTAFVALKERCQSDRTSAINKNAAWCSMFELQLGPNPGLQKVLTSLSSLPNSEISSAALNSRSDSIIQRQKTTGPAVYDPIDNEQPNSTSSEKDLAEITEFVNLWCADGDDCSAWMQETLEMATSTPILYDTLKAIAKLYFGETTKNPEMADIGQQVYIKVLRWVHSELNDSNTDTRIELLIIVVVLAMLELYRPRGESSMSQHWTASLAILERRGPLRHTTGIAHKLFVDLRYHWAIHFLRSRRSSFLSQEEWKTLPWEKPDKKDALQSLLDEVLEIPALLEQFEEYKSLVASKSLSSSEDHIMKEALWARADYIQTQLNQWKNCYAATYPHGSQFKVPEANSIPSRPAFRRWDSKKSKIVTPNPIFYPSSMLAHSMFEAARSSIPRKFIQAK